MSPVHFSLHSPSYIYIAVERVIKQLTGLLYPSVKILNQNPRADKSWPGYGSALVPDARISTYNFVVSNQIAKKSLLQKGGVDIDDFIQWSWKVTNTLKITVCCPVWPRQCWARRETSLGLWTAHPASFWPSQNASTWCCILVHAFSALGSR